MEKIKKGPLGKKIPEGLQGRLERDEVRALGVFTRGFVEIEGIGLLDLEGLKSRFPGTFVGTEFINNRATGHPYAYQEIAGNEAQAA